MCVGRKEREVKEVREWSVAIYVSLELFSSQYHHSKQKYLPAIIASVVNLKGHSLAICYINFVILALFLKAPFARDIIFAVKFYIIVDSLLHFFKRKWTFL